MVSKEGQFIIEQGINHHSTWNSQVLSSCVTGVVQELGSKFIVFCENFQLRLHNLA